MKKIKTLLVAAAALLIGSSAMADGYNRIALSYNNDQYSYNSDAKLMYEGDYSCSTNGFGLNYYRGFGVSSKLPMYVEVGANLNFNFGAKTVTSIEDDYNGLEIYQDKMQMRNINLAIPVNFVYKFNIANKFSIAPYAGINFRFNMASKIRFREDGDDEWGDWQNLYSDDKEDGMGDSDYTWNVFQMGWQIGATFSWRKFSLGLEYGTDFIPAYRHKFDEIILSVTPTVNSGRFKLSLGYTF